MSVAVAYLSESERLAAPTDVAVAPPIGLQVVDADLDSEPSEGTFTADPGVVSSARELVARHPDSATAYSRLAQAELIAGLWIEARADAATAMKLGGENGDFAAIVASAHVLVGLGEAELAEGALRLISHEYIPSPYLRAVIAVQQQRHDKALELLKHAGDTAELALRGWLQIELRHYELAIRDLRAAARSSQPTPDLLVNTGYAYAALGLRNKAIEVTTRAAYMAPADRTAGFNLVAYHLAAAEYDSALKALRRLQQHHPRDLQVVAAIADTMYRRGDGTSALRLLQRHRAAAGKSDASVKDVAELHANIAFLEWRLGRKTKVQAIEALRKELLRCHYESLRIADLLAGLFSRKSELGQLQTLYDGLLTRYEPGALISIRTYLLYLEGDFKQALNTALTWWGNQPFNVIPAALATYLLTDIEQDYQAAVKVGETALKLNPAHETLRNNLAYAHAFAGNPDRASAVLPPNEDSPYYVATRGLIEIVKGNAAKGVGLYDRAAEMAEEWGKNNDEPYLPALIRLRKLMLLAEHGLLAEKTSFHEIEEEAKDDPRFQLFILMSERISGDT